MESRFVRISKLRVPGMGMFLLVLLAALSIALPVMGQPPSFEIPKGIVTMVDIGGDSCTPCKMMLPILRELEGQYRGRAAIISINVGGNRDAARQYGARIIPTQIFYDTEGREVSRHEGFMDRKSIVDTLEKLGVHK